MMDLQVALFCMAVAAVLAFIIYLMIMLSVSSKPTFEEAKANRRKIIRQFQEENKVSSDRTKEKKTKKSTKKVKDRKDNEIIESESGDQELEIYKEQDQVEVTTASLLLPESVPEHKLETFAGRLKEKKKTGQLAPQELCQEQLDSAEKVLAQPTKHSGKAKVSAEKVNEVGTVKENKKKKKETTEKETKDPEKIPEQSQGVNFEVDSSSQLDESSSQSTVQNLIPSSSVTNQPVIKKPSKKKRSEITTLNQLKNEKEAVSISLLVSLIQKAELSCSEIQMLIESLFNEQQDDDSEWLKGRQDPVIKLKKQLADTEQALKDEKEVNIGLQAKLRELRAELTNDHVATKNAEEQLVNLQTELRSLSHRLYTATEEKHAMALNVQQLQKKSNDEQVLIKLKEDQIIKHRIAEEKSHEAVIALQSQVNQLSAKLQENVRITEEYQKMQKDMTRAFESAQFNVKELQAKLKTMERALADAKTEIENHIVTNKNLYEQNEHLSNQLKNQCQEMNVLREKNESFAKMNSENWENGFSYNNKQSIAELEGRLEEKNTQVEQLTSELEFSRNKIQELSVHLTRSKSDLAKNQMLLDSANIEIAALKEKVTEATRPLQDDIISQLKNSLSERNKEVSLLRSEIEMCKQRNNDLRNKNWKIVEALTKAEEALQTKIRNEQNTNEQNLCVRKESNEEVQKIHGTINRLIKHLYPDIIVNDSKESIDEWLDKLEETVMSRSINGADTLNTSELQTHNSQLQALVVHYKGIITDTERMLNQLQEHVEIEETRWKGKIQSLEDEIANLRNNHTSSDVFFHP